MIKQTIYCINIRFYQMANRCYWLFIIFVYQKKYLIVMRSTLVALALALILTKSVLCQTIRFRQDFSSSTVVSSYVSATPTIGQFTSLATSGINAAVRITAGNLEMASTTGSGSTAYFNRTANFHPSGSPAFLIVQFDFEVLSSAQTQLSACDLFIGAEFPDNAAILPNADIYARLSFNLASGSTNFVLRNIASGFNSSSLSGRQRITWVLNNSGATLSYYTPSGIRRSLASDRQDVWANSSLMIDQAITTTPTQNMDEIRFTFQNDNSTIQLDNFLISDDLNVLPITLSHFVGRATAEGHQLRWQARTTGELPTFVVQRSGGANWDNFVTLGQMPYSTGQSSYEWVDRQPLPGQNYYRLAIVAPNQPIQYSSIIAVNQREATAPIVLVHCPITDQLQLTWAGETPARVHIHDVAGRTLLAQPLTSAPAKLDAQSWPSGIYFLTFQTASGSYTKKLVKQ